MGVALTWYLREGPDPSCREPSRASSPARRPSARPIALPGSATTPKAQRGDDRAARARAEYCGAESSCSVVLQLEEYAVCRDAFPRSGRRACRDRERARPERTRLSTRRVEPASRSRRPRRMTRNARRTTTNVERAPPSNSASWCPKPSEAAADSLLSTHDSLGRVQSRSGARNAERGVSAGRCHKSHHCLRRNVEIVAANEAVVVGAGGEPVLKCEVRSSCVAEVRGRH